MKQFLDKYLMYACSICEGYLRVIRNGGLRKSLNASQKGTARAGSAEIDCMSCHHYPNTPTLRVSCQLYLDSRDSIQSSIL